MPDRGPEAPERTTVVVGVDGAGRTHRLDELAAVADGPVLRVGAPPVPSDVLREHLRDAAAGGALVLVDDPHRLDEAALGLLAASARDGVPTVVARRPVIGSAAHADLDEAAAGQGRVEVLAPLDAAGVARLVTALTGAACPPRLAEQVRTASGGLPGVAAALAAAL
ncbi:MAG: LuxR family transcriptional regulator, partial [Actinobacteria bacterium]|nr:LuxR family transcriptional regulator [Actinomycetota bacterium]